MTFLISVLAHKSVKKPALTTRISKLIECYVASCSSMNKVNQITVKTCQNVATIIIYNGRDVIIFFNPG